MPVDPVEAVDVATVLILAGAGFVILATLIYFDTVPSWLPWPSDIHIGGLDFSWPRPESLPVIPLVMLGAVLASSGALIILRIYLQDKRVTQQ